MKKVFAIALVAGLLVVAGPASAQEDTTKKGTVEKAANSVKKGAKKAWKGTKKGAKKVGNETAELATKGKAKATDKKSAEWIGPEGQDIYVDDGNKYYWINEKGARVFVSREKLKAKEK
jgi:hypothetical protein